MHKEPQSAISFTSHSVSNVSKNQYFFVLDITEGIFKKWASAVYEYKNPDTKIPYNKTTHELEYNDTDKTVIVKTKSLPSQTVKTYKDGEIIKFEIDVPFTWSDEYKKYKKKYNPTKSSEQDDVPLEKSKFTDEKTKDTKRTLIQVRYNYGQIQFKNIQSKLNSPYNGVLKFETIDRDYEKYDWFTFNTIDRSLEPKKSINYYADTIFDTESLREYLKSENRLTEKTRLAYEFLKMNYNIPELKKYADFIYDNFKRNINLNLNDTTFVEKIKRSIVDLVFEKNGLIYVKKTNIVAQREKEKADADNYKIVNCNYVSIRSGSVESEIAKYFSRNDSEEKRYLKDKNKNFKEIKNLLNKQDKKTGGFAVVQITRDVISDSSRLLIASECKKRTRRIKGKVKQAMNFFLEGGRTRKRKHTKKYYRT